MAEKEKKSKFEDYTALLSVLLVISQHGRQVEPNSILEAHSDIVDKDFSIEKVSDILEEYKFKYEALDYTFEELKNVPLPAVVGFKNGKYAMLGLNKDETVYIVDPVRSVPIAISSEDFKGVWGGKVYSVRPKLTIAEFSKRYNLEWFLEIILHYKKYFMEVLIATFFIQLMGLLMPLFTQVVIDKVIANAGLSTLTVLGVAVFIMITVGCILTAVKTYIMNFTTNKLDAILNKIIPTSHFPSGKLLRKSKSRRNAV